MAKKKKKKTGTEGGYFENFQLPQYLGGVQEVEVPGLEYSPDAAGTFVTESTGAIAGGGMGGGLVGGAGQIGDAAGAAQAKALGIQDSSAGFALQGANSQGVRGAAAGFQVAGVPGAIIGGIAGFGYGAATGASQYDEQIKAQADAKRINEYVALQSGMEGQDPAYLDDNLSRGNEYDAPAHLRFEKGTSGIKIKKENREKFTKFAGSDDMANKEQYSPTIVKRANFAKNSSKFSKAEDGLVLSGDGVYNDADNNLYKAIEVEGSELIYDQEAGKVVEDFTNGRSHAEGGHYIVAQEGLAIIPKRNRKEFLAADMLQKNAMISRLPVDSNTAARGMMVKGLKKYTHGAEEIGAYADGAKKTSVYRDGTPSLRAATAGVKKAKTNLRKEKERYKEETGKEYTGPVYEMGIQHLNMPREFGQGAPDMYQAGTTGVDPNPWGVNLQVPGNVRALQQELLQSDPSLQQAYTDQYGQGNFVDSQYGPLTQAAYARAANQQAAPGRIQPRGIGLDAGGGGTGRPGLPSQIPSLSTNAGINPNLSQGTDFGIPPGPTSSAPGGDGGYGGGGGAGNLTGQAALGSLPGYAPGLYNLGQGLFGDVQYEDPDAINLSRLSYTDPYDPTRRAVERQKQANISSARNLSGGSIQDFGQKSRLAAAGATQQLNRINTQVGAEKQSISNANISIENKEKLMRLAEKQRVDRLNRLADENKKTYLETGITQLSQAGTDTVRNVQLAKRDERAFDIQDKTLDVYGDYYDDFYTDPTYFSRFKNK